jgi:hypothetical protein
MMLPSDARFNIPRIASLINYSITKVMGNGQLQRYRAKVRRMRTLLLCFAARMGLKPEAAT